MLVRIIIAIIKLLKGENEYMWSEYKVVCMRSLANMIVDCED